MVDWQYNHRVPGDKREAQFVCNQKLTDLWAVSFGDGLIVTDAMIAE